MNHVSIFEKKWLDLVFEGKNKSYGAYQLRLESPRTTIFALFFGLLLLASVVSVGILAAKLGKQQMPVTDIPIGPTITPVVYEPPKPTPPTKSTPPVTSAEEPEPNTKQLRDPVIVPQGQDDDVALTSRPVPPDVPEGTGTPGNNPSPGNPGTGAPSGTGTTPAPPDNTPVPPGTLDKLPAYPGGLDAFYTYVGRNFNRPDIEDVNKVTVIVSFVIEKDGTMTDIRVARDPGYGMAREAIRVLKASKTKWTAGIKNGQPVRTAYTLPITVNIN